MACAAAGSAQHPAASQPTAAPQVIAAPESEHSSGSQNTRGQQDAAPVARPLLVARGDPRSVLVLPEDADYLLGVMRQEFERIGLKPRLEVEQL